MRRGRGQVWSRLQSDDRPKQDQLQELRQMVAIASCICNSLLRFRIHIRSALMRPMICEGDPVGMGGQAYGMHFQTSNQPEI